MKSALIASAGGRMTDFFVDMLAQTEITQLKYAATGGEARRALIERSFDLMVINMPLPDEQGEELALFAIGEKAAEVLLVVSAEQAEDTMAKVEDYGVFTVEKPLYKGTFWAALKMAEASFRRLNTINVENAKLKNKLDELKLISKAKCLLVEKLAITEDAAHKMIEKEAMNSRRQRGEVAKYFLDKYKNN